MIELDPKRPLTTRIIERIPQTIRLRSGLLVELRHRRDVGEFWHLFSSSEYLSLMPFLNRLDMKEGILIDCGAAIGLFSLLIEQMAKVGILPGWGEHRVELIEPSEYNLRQLTRNMKRNLPARRYSIHHGAVGQRSGQVTFHESKRAPWSSSLRDRPGLPARAVTRNYIDLMPLVGEGPCLVKMDIEGAEFEALAAYHELWLRVDALVIEWHAEMGNIRDAEAHLKAGGLSHVKRSWETGDRYVDLYARSGILS